MDIFHLSLEKKQNIELLDDIILIISKCFDNINTWSKNTE